MKRISSLLQKANKKVKTLSHYAFQPKYLPFSIGITIILLIFYIFLFFQWLNGSGPARHVGPATLEISRQTAPEASQQQIAFQVNSDKIQQKNIDGIQIVAALNGNIPEDIRFVPAQIDGLDPVIASISRQQRQTILKVVFLTTPPGTPYTVSSATIDIGTLEYTQEKSGKLKIDFDIALAKILENQTKENFLTSPNDQTF